MNAARADPKTALSVRERDFTAKKRYSEEVS